MSYFWGGKAKLQLLLCTKPKHTIRKKFKLSQAALASVFNVSTSTVQKWEQGNKKPTGASRKLLDIIERKGLEALI